MQLTTALVNVTVIAVDKAVQSLECEREPATEKADFPGKYELLKRPNTFPPGISQEQRERSKGILLRIGIVRVKIERTRSRLRNPV